MKKIVNKAQNGKKVVKKTTITKKKSYNDSYLDDANLLVAKKLKPEPSMGDYKIKGSNSGTTGRVRKNGGKMSTCKHGCK